MRTFKVVDIEHNTVAYGEEIGENIFRVYHPDFEGGYNDFTVLRDMYKATGGYALQTELFPSPIPIQQLTLFPTAEAETETAQTDPRQLTMFE